MGYTIDVNMPDIPQGMDVEFSYLGVFPNGGTYDIPDDRIMFWYEHNVTYDPVTGEPSATVLLEDTVLQEGCSIHPPQTEPTKEK
jgi:hypothetical protein